MNFLVGHWRGASQGEPGQGKGQRDYEFVLRGKFLKLKNKTIYPPQEENPKGEVHEDLGFYSFDNKPKKLVFRQFHKEGFVNEYVEQEGSADGKTLILVSETYKFVNQDEYAEAFELAEPQKEFAIYSESHWKRVK